ncbi:hypothetical protein D3C77_655360 [compost metagenome]
MRREDLGVDGQQVLAFHAGAARTGANQQGHVGVLEGGAGVAVSGHFLQQREGAVIQFHDDALQGLLRFLVGDFQQLQDDGLIFTQHFAGGDAE